MTRAYEEEVAARAREDAFNADDSSERVVVQDEVELLDLMKSG